MHVCDSVVVVVVVVAASKSLGFLSRNIFADVERSLGGGGRVFPQTSSGRLQRTPSWHRYRKLRDAHHQDHQVGIGGFLPASAISASHHSVCIQWHCALFTTDVTCLYLELDSLALVLSHLEFVYLCVLYSKIITKMCFVMCMRMCDRWNGMSWHNAPRTSLLVSLANELHLSTAGEDDDDDVWFDWFLGKLCFFARVIRSIDACPPARPLLS